MFAFGGVGAWQDGILFFGYGTAHGRLMAGKRKEIRDLEFAEVMFVERSRVCWK